MIALFLLFASSHFVIGRRHPDERPIVRWFRVGSRLTMFGSMGLLGMAGLLRAQNVLPGLHWPWWDSVAVMMVVLLGTPRIANLIGRRLRLPGYQF